MDRARAIGTGAVVAAVITHGIVFSAMFFNEVLPISTYQRFFQQIVIAAERLWSYAHGWQPMSHMRDFGGFFALMVHLICPLIGFAVFWMLSRHKVGTKVWKPLAIALLLDVPPVLSSLTFGPCCEAARTVIIVLLMAWSVGAIRLSRSHIFPTKSLATA